MDNEATLTGSIICLKYDSTFHIKTWYSTPSISYRDYEVFVDLEEIKTQSNPDLRKAQMGKRDIFQDWQIDAMSWEYYIISLETSRRHEISWEDSLVSMIEEEASQKEWDMDFSLRLEGKLVVTPKIDLT